VLRAISLGLLPALAVHLCLRFAGVERFWVAVGVYHALCVAVPAVARTRGEAGGPPRWVGSSAVLALALGAGIWALGRELYARGWMVPAETRPLLLLVEPWRLFAVYSLAVNGFLEEWFWRRFLLARSGVVPGAALFALMHFAGLVVVVSPLEAALLSAPTFVAGLVWGWMRRASGSLWPCVITHIGADAGVLALFQAIRAS